MNLNTLDMRLQLPIDNYLKEFESFQFIDKVMNAYNKLDSVKDIYTLDLRDNKFYNTYGKVYQLLSVLTMKRNYDDNELIFTSNIAYKQKGSIESIKTILGLIKCEYSNLEVDENLVLHMNISLEDVREIYLAQKYLQILCQDLLFYNTYDVSIDHMSVRYKLSGAVDKRYAIYTTYDLDTIVNVVTSTTTSDSDTLDEATQDSTTVETTLAGLKKTTEVKTSLTTDNRFKVTTTVTEESFKELDVTKIDTYNW